MKFSGCEGYTNSCVHEIKAFGEKAAFMFKAVNSAHEMLQLKNRIKRTESVAGVHRAGGQFLKTIHKNIQLSVKNAAYEGEDSFSFRATSLMRMVSDSSCFLGLSGLLLVLRSLEIGGDVRMVIPARQRGTLWDRGEITSIESGLERGRRGRGTSSGSCSQNYSLQDVFTSNFKHSEYSYSASDFPSTFKPFCVPELKSKKRSSSLPSLKLCVWQLDVRTFKWNSSHVLQSNFSSSTNINIACNTLQRHGMKSFFSAEQSLVNHSMSQGMANTPSLMLKQIVEQAEKKLPKKVLLKNVSGKKEHKLDYNLENSPVNEEKYNKKGNSKRAIQLKIINICCVKKAHFQGMQLASACSLMAWGRDVVGAVAGTRSRDGRWGRVTHDGPMGLGRQMWGQDLTGGTKGCTVQVQIWISHNTENEEILVACQTQGEDLGPAINLSSRKLIELKTGPESAPACCLDSSLLFTMFFFLKRSSVSRARSTSSMLERSSERISESLQEARSTEASPSMNTPELKDELENKGQNVYFQSLEVYEGNQDTVEIEMEKRKSLDPTPHKSMGEKLMSMDRGKSKNLIPCTHFFVDIFICAAEKEKHSEKANMPSVHFPMLTDRELIGEKKTTANSLDCGKSMEKKKQYNYYLGSKKTIKLSPLTEVKGAGNSTCHSAFPFVKLLMFSAFLSVFLCIYIFCGRLHEQTDRAHHAEPKAISAGTADQEVMALLQQWAGPFPPLLPLGCLRMPTASLAAGALLRLF
ncbi:hypothetical protein EK904_010150 [Melospiza melodia maxima]|nr:hypothetical protein EK904_010150 [Melospiza melodia maxima]